MNFETFRGIVDAIGTVPVYFPAPARDEQTGLNVPTFGCAQLDGPSALAFVRSRSLEVLDPATNRWRSADPVPDIGRVARQQAFLRVLGSVAMDKALSNPFSAPNIINHAVDKLKLDGEFGRGDLFSLVAAFRGDPDSGSLETLTLPWTDGTEDGQSVLFPKEPEADQLLARLRDFTEPPPVASARRTRFPASAPYTLVKTPRNAGERWSASAIAYIATKAIPETNTAIAAVPTTVRSSRTCQTCRAPADSSARQCCSDGRGRGSCTRSIATDAARPPTISTIEPAMKSSP